MRNDRLLIALAFGYGLMFGALANPGAETNPALTGVALCMGAALIAVAGIKRVFAAPLAIY